MSWLGKIRELTNIRSAEQFFTLVEDRQKFVKVIANVRGTGQGT